MVERTNARISLSGFCIWTRGSVVQIQRLETINTKKKDHDQRYGFCTSDMRWKTSGRLKMCRGKRSRPLYHQKLTLLHLEGSVSTYNRGGLQQDWKHIQQGCVILSLAFLRHKYILTLVQYCWYGIIKYQPVFFLVLLVIS